MPVVGRIIPEEKSLAGLLSESNRMFEIPKYQRKYSWGEEALEFLRDILTIAKNKEYFIGPMIFIENDSKNTSLFPSIGISNIRIYEIIDGQQRLITTAMIISIIRDILRILSRTTNNPRLSIEAQRTADGLNRLILLTNYKGDAVSSKFRYSFYDEKILQLLIDEGIPNLIIESLGEDGDKNLINRTFIPSDIIRRLKKVLYKMGYKKYSTIISTYLDLLEEISNIVFNITPENELTLDSKLIEQIDMFIDTLQNVKTVVLIVDNENDAFLIFETLNDRGLRLGPLDLIKNYLLRVLSKTGDDEKVTIYSDVWDELTGDNKDAERYVWYYLLVQRYRTSSEAPKLSKKNLYSEIKKKIKTPNDVIAFIDNLVVIFDYNNALKQKFGASYSDDLIEIVNRLEALGVKQHLPLVFSLILCDDINPKDAFQYLLEFYKLALRFKITKTNWNKIERRMGYLVNAVCSPNHNLYRSTIKEIMPSDEVVRQSFIEYVVRKRNDSVAREVLIWLNEYLLSTDTRHLKPKPNLTIEHLIPVSTKKSYPEIDMFGNLILVDRSLNSTLKTKKISAKLQILTKTKGDDLPVTKIMFEDFRKARDNSEKLREVIRDRTEELAAIFIKSTSLK